MYIGKCSASATQIADDPVFLDDSSKTKEELIAEAKEQMVNQMLADAERTHDLFIKMKNEYLLKKNSGSN